MLSRATTTFSHVKPGIKHFLFDDSQDMEYLEIVPPANFGLIDADPVCDIPPEHRGSS